MLRVNDFFCGGGGMGLGFKQAGFEVAGAWDFDKYAVESYKHNISPKVKQADITQMIAEEVPFADVWTFGFPCVDLSTIGKMEGMVKGKTRSGLFFEVMRLLEGTDKSKLPKVILAENVRGVDKYFTEIEDEFEERGYKFYKQLYNSNRFVPQNRDRFFLIGVHESIEKRFVFFDEPKESKTNISDCLENNYSLTECRLSDLAKTKILERLGDRNGFAYNYYNDRVFQKHEKAPTMTTQCSAWTRSSCLILIEDKENLRKLTTREVANLQGFPSDYKFLVSSEQLYKQFGNAVSVPVAKFIAEQIRDFLS